jgi:hypothetical protein
MKEFEKETGSGVARDEAAVQVAGGEIHASPSGGASAEEQIGIRAYALYRERGGKIGDDAADRFPGSETGRVERRQHDSRR